jgi:integrase
MPTESSTIEGMRGSVRKPRTDGGTWSYRLDLGFDDVGKRRQREIGGFRTKKEAQAALNDALSGVQRGTFVAPSRTTVRDFLELWLDGVKTEVALTAWVSYRQSVRRYINPHLGSKRLGELSALDVKRWHGVLLTSGRQDGRPLATNSVKLAHRVLHRALADAVRWNLIFVNPVSSVRVPKGTTPEQRVWTAAEARQFLDALADDRLVALWTLALHTGMRRGELAGLRWSDVDLDAGTLTVAQQRTSANYEEVIAAPKAKSHRQLLLAPATVVALRDHLRRQREERLRLGPAWTDSGYLFVDEAGSSTTRSDSRSCSPKPSRERVCRRSGYTTPATRWRRWRSKRACIPRWCKSNSVTPQSPSRSTPTRGSRKPFDETAPTRSPACTAREGQNRSAGRS